MLALKINITKFIKQEEKDRIFKYSKSLAECYNLALSLVFLNLKKDLTAVIASIPQFRACLE